VGAARDWVGDIVGTFVGEEVVAAAASVGDILRESAGLAVGKKVEALVGVGPAIAFGADVGVGEDIGTTAREYLEAAVGAVGLAVDKVRASVDNVQDVVGMDVGKAVVGNAIMKKGWPLFCLESLLGLHFYHVNMIF